MTTKSALLGGVFDVAGKAEEIARLEQESVAPDFWDDPETAQRKMQRLADLKQEVELWDDLESRVTDLVDLLEMAQAADDHGIAEEIAGEVAEIEAQLAQLEDRLLLSGEYDSHDAILAIHAGAGGTESQDWAQMLLRMYLRWAQN
ncbi:MAG: PCRF domain-containing protein, partial [Chloroflexi bacterium]